MQSRHDGCVNREPAALPSLYNQPGDLPRREPQHVDLSRLRRRDPVAAGKEAVPPWDPFRLRRRDPVAAGKDAVPPWDPFRREAMRVRYGKRIQ